MTPAYEMSPDHSASTPIPAPPWWVLLIAGGISGVIGWGSTFPMDVVKTRVQGTDWTPRTATDAEHLPLNPSTMSSGRSALYTVHMKENPYRSTLSTIVNSYREEGVNVFFRGLSPTLLR